MTHSEHMTTHFLAKDCAPLCKHKDLEPITSINFQWPSGHYWTNVAEAVDCGGCRALLLAISESIPASTIF